MKTTTLTLALADTLQALWDLANAALEDPHTDAITALEQIADLAAEALADLPLSLAVEV